ncbi:hypothetical protein QUB05_32625 [Microcoleus sp. F10-C6]|uniref:hypothetical protein n=1 Tax=unclassified Microcoleus TaxID=2642155 RepID=UPI002FD36FA5
MPLSADCPSGRSQLLMFPRRELLQKIASAALLFFVPRIQPATLPLNGYPLPKFNIGDLIAADWIGEFGEDYIEFGEVVGLCHRPKDGWVYYINWTHSNTSDDFCYPCFEGEPTTGDNLRLVSHD